MRNIAIILFLKLLTGCSHSDPANYETEEANSFTGETGNIPVATGLDNDETDDDDCIFNPDIQTADFLKNIKEFEGYKWDDKTKTAGIRSGKDSVAITRGGCMHYSYYITLYSGAGNLNIDDTDYWIDKISKIASLLPDFENELINKLLKEENFTLDRTPEHLYFTLHQDIYCHMSLIIKRDEQNIISVELGYYLC
jgi:hypothetical protein